jgi:thioesterase domain-containing protein
VPVPDAGTDDAFLAAVLAAAVARGSLPENTPLDLLRRRWRAFNDLTRLGLDYRPRRHGSATVLIRAQASAVAAPRQVAACRALTVGAFEVHTVAGSHHDLLRPPGVTAVAALVARVLA